MWSAQVFLSSQFILLSSLHSVRVIRKRFLGELRDRGGNGAVSGNTPWHYIRPLCCPWRWIWFVERCSGMGDGRTMPLASVLWRLAEVSRNPRVVEPWVFSARVCASLSVCSPVFPDIVGVLLLVIVSVVTRLCETSIVAIFSLPWYIPVWLLTQLFLYIIDF